MPQRGRNVEGISPAGMLSSRHARRVVDLDLTWLDDPAALVATWPVFALPLMVFVSAYIEYVFPPYPGDSLILLGFFLAAHGAAEPWLIFLVALLGASLGAATAYQLGQRFGVVVMERFARFSGRETPLARLRHLFGLFGEKVLALNRFLPFLRNFLLYAAGASAQRFGAAMAWTALSNLLFVSVLAWLGGHAAASWGDIQHSFKSFGGVLAVVAIVLLCGFGIARRIARVRAVP